MTKLAQNTGNANRLALIDAYLNMSKIRLSSRMLGHAKYHDLADQSMLRINRQIHGKAS
ncbi:hypothetical protein [Arsenicibacter rosenii]|nr:hypothetical protein [Arsenicibacter rosenii]